jgi:hypothetical protein
LLDAGVGVNSRYDNELTVLMWAAGYGKDETVRFLLAHGAATDARDNRGQTALDMALAGGHQATAELLRAR